MPIVENDDYIRIRIPSQTKAQFKELCQKKAINSSELLRQLINNWIAEQEKE